MPEHSDVAVDTIPIIDIAGFRDGSAKDRVVRQVQEAAETVGFLYIAGHDVDQAVIDGAFDASRAFFALPEADKLTVKINSSHRGFMPINNSTYTADLKPNFNETFLAGLDLGPDDPDVKAGVPLHGPNQWPTAMPALRPAIDTYFNALRDIGDIVLRIFGRALDLDEDYFLPYFKKPMPFVRLLHYPPQPPTRAENEFGIAPHTDYGFVTILAQDEVGGLQVRRRDGGWIDAPYIPGTFVVNIADMLKRWTNDRWLSTPHRVINTTGRERYSIPFFFDPTYHTLVECIPGCNRNGEAPKYPPITWGDYLKRRFDSTYDYRKAKRQDGA